MVAERAYSTARAICSASSATRMASPPMTFRLGAVATAQGDLEKARRLWRRAARSGARPRIRWAIQVLGFGGLEIRSGDVERGLGLAERSLDMACDAAGGCGSPGDRTTWRRPAGRRQGPTPANSTPARHGPRPRAGAAAGHRIRALLLGWAAHQRGGPSACRRALGERRSRARAVTDPALGPPPRPSSRTPSGGSAAGGGADPRRGGGARECHVAMTDPALTVARTPRLFGHFVADTRRGTQCAAGGCV